MNPLFQRVFDKYNQTLKPLLAEQEARQHQFAEPILPKIAEAFDFIALADDMDMPENNMLEYVSEAEGLMEECVSLSYQYIIYDIRGIINDFEKKVDKRGRENLSGGKFVGYYEQCKRKAEQLLEEADGKLLIESVPSMEKACESYREIEAAINSQYPGITMASYQKVTKARVLGEHFVGIIVSLAVGIGLGLLLEMLVR